MKRALLVTLLVILGFAGGYALRAWLTPYVILGVVCVATKTA